METNAAKNPTCTLLGNPTALSVYNELADNLPLYNTRNLFLKASLPHFNFTADEIDQVVLQNADDFNLVRFDPLKDKIQKVMVVEDFKIYNDRLMHELQSSNKKLVLITSKKNKHNFNFLYTVYLEDKDLVGNTEPVWRKLKTQIKEIPDIFVLDLGPEKFLIGPRLKMMFQRTVVDFSKDPNEQITLKDQLKSFIKKVLYPI